MSKNLRCFVAVALLSGCSAYGQQPRPSPGSPPRPSPQPPRPGQVMPSPPPGVPAPPPLPEPPQPPGPPQPTQLQIDVYQIDTTAERMAPMDLSALGENSPSRKELLRRLGEFGTTRLLAQWHTAVDLKTETRLTNGRRVPVLAVNSPNSPSGNKPSINYESIGVNLNLDGAWRGGKQAEFADVRLDFGISGVGKSSIESIEEVSLPTFDNFSIQQCLTLEDGRPTLMMHGSLPEPSDEKGRTVVYVLSMMVQRLKDQAVPSTRPAEEANAGRPALVHVDVVKVTAKSDKLNAKDLKSQIPNGATLQEGLAAIKQSGAAEVLSSPSLLVKWPSEAEIQIGERVPFVKEIAQDAAGKPAPQVDYAFVGLSLKIRGRWLDGPGAERAEIGLNAQQTSVGTSSVSVASGVTLPTFTSRTWETVASVEAGQAVWLATERPTPAEKGKESFFFFRLSVDRTAS